jgi:hypothetical protein
MLIFHSCYQQFKFEESLVRFNSEVSGIKFCFFCGFEHWALKRKEQKWMRDLWNTFAPNGGECCVMWSCAICTAREILGS